jgi:hypothetical protein
MNLNYFIYYMSHNTTNYLVDRNGPQFEKHCSTYSSHFSLGLVTFLLHSVPK